MLGARSSISGAPAASRSATGPPPGELGQTKMLNRVVRAVCDAGPVIEKVVALQDHLGWLHDADVAAGLARAFLVEHAGDLTEPESAAIGRYLVDRERQLAKLRRTVGVPWRGVSSLAFRRSLGRLVAGL